MAKRRKGDSSDISDSEQSDRDASDSRVSSKKRPRHSREDPEDEEDERERRRREDLEWEEANEDRIRAALEKNMNRKGRIAEMGIIQEIILSNFLCHGHYKVTLGPQLNYVTGHNGSGKSAVLTAITVALGGKATSTGRGTGLKSFIKEGETWAEVEIRLKNEGPEAYRPKTYGKSIYITRRFDVSGASSFKLKGQLSKTIISSKRAELNAITDHMGIQVDNPLNVLTQDLARQFIGNSSPQEKYQFFLKGTQLQQLSEEYEHILETLNRTSTVLGQKAQALPELKAASREALVRWNEGTAAREQAKSIEDLSRELAWAHVQQKEKDLTKLVEELENKKSRLPRIEEEVRKAQLAYDETRSTIQSLDDQLLKLGESQEAGNAALRQRKEELMKKQRDIRDEIQDAENDKRQINSAISRATQEIREYDRQIGIEQKKLADQTSGKRAELETKIAERKVQIAAGENKSNELREKFEHEIRLKQEKEALAQQKEREYQQLRNQHGILKTNRQQLDGQLKNKFSAFGNNILEVINAVGKTQWQGAAPIGPLGRYVDVRDRKWLSLVKTAIGGAMSSWVVEHAQDRAKLRQILDQFQNQQVNILVSGRDLFDYSVGEPTPDFVTILRVIEVSDPFVLRVLINQAHIEAICLAETRKQADDTLIATNTFHRFMTLDGLNVVRYRDGGGMTTVLNMNNNAGLFTGSETEMRHRLSEIDAELKGLEEQVGRLGGEKSQLARDVQVHERQAGKIKGQQDQLTYAQGQDKRDLERMKQEALEAAPAEISAFEQAKADQEAEKEKFLVDIENAQKRIIDLRAQMEPILTQVREIDDQMNNSDHEKRELGAKIVQVAGQLPADKHRLDGWQEKLTKQKHSILTLETEVETLTEEFSDWTGKAFDRFGEKWPNPRSPTIVQNEREKLQTALRAHQKKVGASLDELDAEMVRTSQIYETTKRDFQELEKVLTSLKSSLSQRMGKWTSFRKHMSIRAKTQFSYHLANRGYVGRLIMDHNSETHAGTLQLKVQTGDISEEASRDKDPKSLSGGEKSFATICLLLALWEAVGCPIRACDEFDVFMDAVNRNMSMNMIIETAKASDSRQYILITPLDITSIKRSEEITIVRLRDPERGQTKLDFRRQSH